MNDAPAEVQLQGLAPTQRLFVAATPCEAVRDALAEVQTQLRPRLPPRAVKWTPPEQIHLTLRFLGAVRNDSVAELGKALARVAAEHTAFGLSAAGLGVFPSSHRPRVIWAGLAGNVSELAALQSSVQVATEPWGEREDKPFHAHLTLGRVRDLPPSQLREVSGVLACFEAGALGDWNVRELELVRSELRPEGALHTRLRSYELRG